MVTEYATWSLEKLAQYSFVSFASWENFTAAIGKVSGIFTDFDSAMAWPYLLVSLAIAGGVFIWAKQDDATRPRSLGAFLFPREVYLHSSAILDYKFYAINLLMNVLIYVPIMVGMGALGYKLMSAIVIGVFAWQPPTTLSSGQLLGAAFGFFMLHDFINYWVHVLFHRVPALWAFHRVHHSAQVLTPFTAFRTHPMELFFPTLLQMPVIGLAAVFFREMSPRDMEVTTICGVGLFTFIVGLIASHLRHSPVWLSYGPVLSRVYISPAQHQIHHSVDSGHRDKNFGVKFAFWDALFGTLYVPNRRETIRVGLPDADVRDFRTVTQLYFLPVAWALKAGKQGGYSLDRKLVAPASCAGNSSPTISSLS